MATISKTKTSKWCAQIRTHQKYISKTFISKAHASKWAKEVEYQLDREQFEDFSDSAKLSLGDMLTMYFKCTNKIMKRCEEFHHLYFTTP